MSYNFDCSAYFTLKKKEIVQRRFVSGDITNKQVVKMDYNLGRAQLNRTEKI